MDFDTILLSTLIPVIIVLITMCLLSCLRCGRRNPGKMSRSLPVSAAVYTVPTNYNAVSPNSLSVPVHTTPPTPLNRNLGHHRISSQGDRFAVPLDLLPSYFDYNAPGVEHKGSYVLVKDLKLIQTPTNDEYLKQSPYNPHYMVEL